MVLGQHPALRIGGSILFGVSERVRQRLVALEGHLLRRVHFAPIVIETDRIMPKFLKFFLFNVHRFLVLVTAEQSHIQLLLCLLKPRVFLTVLEMNFP